MPPFLGTPKERRALARWLASLNGNEATGNIYIGEPSPGSRDLTQGDRDAK